MAMLKCIELGRSALQCGFTIMTAARPRHRKQYSMNEKHDMSRANRLQRRPCSKQASTGSTSSQYCCVAASGDEPKLWSIKTARVWKVGSGCRWRCGSVILKELSVPDGGKEMKFAVELRRKAEAEGGRLGWAWLQGFLVSTTYLLSTTTTDPSGKR